MLENWRLSTEWHTSGVCVFALDKERYWIPRVKPALARWDIPWVTSMLYSAWFLAEHRPDLMFQRKDQPKFKTWDDEAAAANLTNTASSYLYYALEQKHSPENLQHAYVLHVQCGYKPEVKEWEGHMRACYEPEQIHKKARIPKALRNNLLYRDLRVLAQKRGLNIDSCPSTPYTSSRAISLLPPDHLIDLWYRRIQYPLPAEKLTNE